MCYFDFTNKANDWRFNLTFTHKYICFKSGSKLKAARKHDFESVEIIKLTKKSIFKFFQ